MTMMHLKYPRKRGHFFWDELGCLARSLGFKTDVFYANIPDEDSMKHQPCIHIEDLVNMMDMYKYYHRALDKSYNLHSEEWNLAASKKALQLLNHHLLSFQDLHSVRVAYQVYECVDMKGMLIEEHTLLRALKMCGRTVAPMKMMHRIKHLSSSYDEEGRIQLHEFLDLVLWCSLYEKLKIEGEKLEAALSKDNRNLFNLDDFHQVLSPYDERLARYLNSTYLAQEWDFGREKLGSKKMSRDPPVNTDKHRQQIRYYQEMYLPLQSEVSQSQQRVHSARAGYVRTRPISAPHLEMYKHSDRNTAPVERLRPHTVYTSLSQQLLRSKSRSAKSDTIADEVSRPSVAEYNQRQLETPSIVNDADKFETHYQMEDIQFDLETNDSRHEIYFEHDMEFILPGYKDRMASKPKPAHPPPPPAPKPPQQPCPSAEFINKLTYPVSRVPPPSHAKVCDARHRGWHPVKTKKGSHHVLADTQYTSSPKARLIDKLQRTAAAQLGKLHRKHIYRYTKPDQIQQDVAHRRPSTAAVTSSDHSEKQQAWEYVNGSRRPSTASRVSLAVSEQVDSSDKDKEEYLQKLQNEVNNKVNDINCRVTKAGKVALLENIMENAEAEDGVVIVKTVPHHKKQTKFLEDYSVDKLAYYTTSHGDQNTTRHADQQACGHTTTQHKVFDYITVNLSNNETFQADHEQCNFRHLANQIIDKVDQIVFFPKQEVSKSESEILKAYESKQRLAKRVRGAATKNFQDRLRIISGAT